MDCVIKSEPDDIMDDGSFEGISNQTEDSCKFYPRQTKNDLMTKTQALQAEGNKTDENSEEDFPLLFVGLLNALSDNENVPVTHLQTFAPCNDVLLRKKVYCFACGYETLKKTEDRAFHHWKYHLHDYIKHIQPNGNNTQKEQKADCVLRYIIAFAEKLNEEGFLVRSFDYQRKVYRQNWETNIMRDIESDSVVYFFNAPPFFAFTYKDLIQRAHPARPSHVWGYLRSKKKVTYAGKIASAHGRFEGLKFILKHTNKDVLYKHKYAMCKHGNRMNDCVLLSCLKTKKHQKCIRGKENN